MANVHFSDFASASTIGDSDLVVGLQGGLNIKYTYSQIKTYIQSAGLTNPGQNFAPTAEKTSAYNAVVGEAVRTNTTSGSVAVTLPTAPADKSTIQVKMTTQGGTNTTTISTGGSDTFNKAGGGTLSTISLLNQEYTFQYNSAESFWLVTTNSAPLSQLDLRYSYSTTITNSMVLASPKPATFSTTFSTGTPSYRNLVNTDLDYGNQLKYRLTSTPFGFGDSFMVGNSTGMTPANGFIQQMNLRYGIVINNQAVAGRGVNVAALAAYSTMPTFGNRNSVITMFGLNDLNRGGAAAYNKLQIGHAAILANTWLASATAASAMTNTGTWSNFTTITGKASNLSGNSRQSSTIGDHLDITITTNNFVIFTYGTDGTTYNYGRFTVSVDGNVIYTYNPNGLADLVSDGVTDNGRIPNALYFDNLGNASHNFVITLLDAKTTIIDAVGYLANPVDCPAVFVASVPRLVSTYTSGSDAITTASKEYIRAAINYFPGYPAVLVDVDNFYNVATDITTFDNIHPNNSGHGHLFDAYESSVQGSGSVFDKIFISTTTKSGINFGDKSGVSATGTGGIQISAGALQTANNIFTATATSASLLNLASNALVLYSNPSGQTIGTTYSPTEVWRVSGATHTYTGATSLLFTGLTQGNFITLNSISSFVFDNNAIRVMAGVTQAAGTWTARATTAAMINVTQSGLGININTSLTNGNPYTPTSVYTFTGSGISASPLVQTSAWVSAFTLNPAANTGYTANTSFITGLNIAASTQQWATGAYSAAQTFNKIGVPTMSFVGASTVSAPVYNLVIDAPAQGTNATFPTNLQFGLGVNGNFAVQNNTYHGSLTTAPTAVVHIKAGTATANTAPLKFTAPAALLGTPEALAIEPAVNGDYINYTTTTGTVRRVLVGASSGRVTAQVAANASVATYTLGATDATYDVGANINVTAATTATFTVTCTYTDETNTSRTVTFSFVQNGVAVPIQTITNVTGIGAYAGMTMQIRCKASTAITIATTGTFTSVTYNAEGIIKQVA